MTRYEKGFIEKCAEYGVDGNAVLEQMQKRAGLERVLSAIGKFYRKPGKMIHSVTAVPAAVGKGGHYASSGGSGLNEVSKLGKGGLRWDRILATLGITGAAGAGTAAALSGGQATSALSPAAKASLLAALGIGGAAAGTAAVASKKKDRGDKEDDKKKRSK